MVESQIKSMNINLEKELKDTKASKKKFHRLFRLLHLR